MFKLSVFAAVSVTLVACSGSASNEEIATGAGEVSAVEAITLQNFIGHPKIVAVRKEVEAIDAAKLPTEHKDLCANAGHGEFGRAKTTDASGKIRTLVIELGSDDSAQTETHYYDAKGTLRFVFTTRNDVHGNSSEERVYFDESGARLFDVFRHAHDEDLNADIEHAPFEITQNGFVMEEDAKDPAKMWSAPPRCD